MSGANWWSGFAKWSRWDTRPKFNSIDTTPSQRNILDTECSRRGLESCGIQEIRLAANGVWGVVMEVSPDAEVAPDDEVGCLGGIPTVLVLVFSKHNRVLADGMAQDYSADNNATDLLRKLMEDHSDG